MSKGCVNRQLKSANENLSGVFKMIPRIALGSSLILPGFEYPACRSIYYDLI